MNSTPCIQAHKKRFILLSALQTNKTICLFLFSYNTLSEVFLHIKKIHANNITKF